MLQQVTYSQGLIDALALANDPDKVSHKWGFTVGQRVRAQAVAKLPVRTFEGTILQLWSDGTATVRFDYQIPFDAERELVNSGRVDLHYLTRVAS